MRDWITAIAGLTMVVLGLSAIIKERGDCLARGGVYAEVLDWPPYQCLDRK